MKYAVIAAGEGSRLSKEGIDVPKPLVKVHGESLIDRLIRIFMEHEADEIIVICNEAMPDVYAHLCDLKADGFQDVRVPLRLLMKRTPSSMHSLYAMSPWLKDSPFCLTTVDTVFLEQAFADYIRTFNQAVNHGVDALMGVTRYVDDEKPLYVETDSALNILDFHDQNPGHRTFISGGIYGLHPRVLDTLAHCIERGEHRMRNFQRALIAEQLKVMAYDMGPVMDIDHASDIPKAEEFLRNPASLLSQIH